MYTLLYIQCILYYSILQTDAFYAISFRHLLLFDAVSNTDLGSICIYCFCAPFCTDWSFVYIYCCLHRLVVRLHLLLYTLFLLRFVSSMHLLVSDAVSSTDCCSVFNFCIYTQFLHKFVFSVHLLFSGVVSCRHCNTAFICSFCTHSSFLTSIISENNYFSTYC